MISDMFGAGVGLGTMLFLGFLMLLLAALAIAGFIFWIAMLIDCIKRDDLSDGAKVAWVIVIIFVHAIGALIYYLAVKRK